MDVGVANNSTIDTAGSGGQYSILDICLNYEDKGVVDGILKLVINNLMTTPPTTTS